MGGGQLGRMLALAGYPLGLHFFILDAVRGPAFQVAPGMVGDLLSPEVLANFADGCDVITWEFENVPVATAELLSSTRAVYPPPRALAVSQDRSEEKAFLNALSIETAPWSDVQSLEELRSALARFGSPCILKTARNGYDGRGQARVGLDSNLNSIWDSFKGEPVILEQVVPFDRELSMIAVRAIDGGMCFYPLVQNTHAAGILATTVAPAPAVGTAINDSARAIARRIMEELNYVGVLAVELFQTGDSLLVNEIAPRVHNSGHWSIEGSNTSQFENHVRALCGLPLGDVSMRGEVRMSNIIGTMPDIEKILAVPDAHLHLYGKEPRDRRKLGHVTVCSANSSDAESAHKRVLQLLSEMPDQQHPALSSASAPAGGGVG